MDIVITTSDPESIDTDEIREALEGAGYFVDVIEIRDRGL